MQSHYPSSGMVMTEKLEQQRMLAKILRYCNLQTLLVGIKHSTAIKKKKLVVLQRSMEFITQQYQFLVYTQDK